MTLPTGETLPDYDDQHPEGVDTVALHAWLMRSTPLRWDSNPAAYGLDRNLIRDVLAAFQAVGDATLVKNGTYRALRRDAADVERLAAGLIKYGHARAVIEHNGSPVDAALAVIPDETSDPGVTA